MKNFIFFSIKNFSVLIFLSFLQFFAISAEKSDKLNSYLLIGASDRSGKGAVFRCTLEGKNCIEFLGGNKKFKDSSNPTYTTPNLFIGDSFGSSLFIYDNLIYIGAISRNNKKATDAGSISSANFKDDVGTIFECKLNGDNCREFIGGHVGFPIVQDAEGIGMRQFSGDYFGVSLFFYNDKLYAGAYGRDSNSKDETGVLVRCNADGRGCIEFIGGKNKATDKNKLFSAYDHFGYSVNINKNKLFVGAKNKNGGSGAVFKCNLDGSQCSLLNVSNLKLSTNDTFGSDLASNANNLFVGAMGRNGYPPSDPEQYDIGAVFKCNSDGNNCSEFLGGQNKSSARDLGLAQDDFFGSSIALTSEYIFIGAKGRKDNNDNRVGAVFRCKLDGSECLELVGGKNQEYLKSASFELNDGEFFGSSLAIVTLSEEN
ncbi:MAG: hypothetical protein DCC88_01955 [Spirobacillus cienkowskii]|jgi:hypothetical protein|uniref:Uncharacterized protein n=1 Tax=Spirobacillus cienkowskii TaxID=495820 RepID=A0A369KTF1_9BACT|nr:MAG: hypothetical protein DCC88_01955 [Spirobacillus cienkowskii]